MKYLKQYEYKKDEPHIKDYVMCDPEPQLILISISPELENELTKFINNNVGQIIDKKREYDYGNPNNTDKFEKTYYIEFIVKYKNIPDSLQDIFLDNDDTNDANNILLYKQEDILFWSKNKPELKAKIFAKKYNL
jgi:hypothetical protein